MQLVLQFHEKVTTTSMLIAEKFGKEHKNVLRAIESLECSEGFTKLNFELSEYNGRNGKNKFYFITRDGFSMLVMGFTGKLATSFKEDFIEQFNKMEETLRKATTPTLIATYQARILSQPTLNCPSSKWNVFDQSHELMLLIEKEIGSINKFDLIDGSIGQHWSKYREGKTWRKPITSYWHAFHDRRGNQLSKCYDYTELEHFKVWLHSAYKCNHLGNYLKGKFRGAKLMMERVNEFLPKLMIGRHAA